MQRGRGWRSRRRTRRLRRTRPLQRTGRQRAAHKEMQWKAVGGGTTSARLPAVVGSSSTSSSRRRAGPPAPSPPPPVGYMRSSRRSASTSVPQNRATMATHSSADAICHVEPGWGQCGLRMATPPGRGQCISDLPPPAARSGLDQRGAVGLGGRKHPNAPCFRRRHNKERQWEADGRFCRSRSA